MTEINLKIDGMSCGHCVMSVKNAIDKIEGINSSEVTVGHAKVGYNESKTSKDEIVRAVQSAGFKIAG